MPIPRSQLVDPEVAMYYHIVSRCVRRSWLCGRDPVTERNFDHRKDQLVERLLYLSRFFAVAIPAYAVMSNHFHLVVYYDPKACETWSDEEVVRRWIAVTPSRCKEINRAAIDAERRIAILEDPAALASARGKLGCLSTFMKFLKQPIARSANLDDDCTGHFFEGRFYSGALLDEKAVLAAMAYVDLNPIRAKVAASIEEIRHASIEKRLVALASSPERLEQALTPIVSGLEGPSRPPTLIEAASYVSLVRSLAETLLEGAPLKTNRQRRWLQRFAVLRDRGRALGSPFLLHRWAIQRQWKSVDAAFI